VCVYLHSPNIPKIPTKEKLKPTNKKKKGIKIEKHKKNKGIEGLVYNM